MMNTKFVKVGTAAIVAAGLSLAAVAAPPMATKGDSDGDGAISKAEAVAKANMRFERMDANQDGRIDATDRDARVKSRFAAMDADKNGNLSEAEFIAAHANRMNRTAMGEGRGRDAGSHKGRRGHHGVAMLRAADGDGDGVITRSEMNAGVAAHFAKMDSNADGMITRAERAAARKAMREQHRAATKG